MRMVFGSSQKRRNETSDLEPSSSRSRIENVKESEFDESDISDNEYEEFQLDDEPDYEEDEMLLLNNDFVEACDREDYGGWKRTPPAEFRDSFSYEVEERPLPHFNSEEDAFTSIISPGIINM